MSSEILTIDICEMILSYCDGISQYVLIQVCRRFLLACQHMPRPLTRSSKICTRYGYEFLRKIKPVDDGCNFTKKLGRIMHGEIPVKLACTKPFSRQSMRIISSIIVSGNIPLINQIINPKYARGKLLGGIAIDIGIIHGMQKIEELANTGAQKEIIRYGNIGCNAARGIFARESFSQSSYSALCVSAIARYADDETIIENYSVLGTLVVQNAENSDIYLLSKLLKFGRHQLFQQLLPKTMERRPAPSKFAKYSAVKDEIVKNPQVSRLNYMFFSVEAAMNYAAKTGYEIDPGFARTCIRWQVIKNSSQYVDALICNDPELRQFLVENIRNMIETRGKYKVRNLLHYLPAESDQ